MGERTKGNSQRTRKGGPYMVSSVQFERRWLAGLLANKITVALLLRFLKAAGVRREKNKDGGI